MGPANLARPAAKGEWQSPAAARAVFLGTLLRGAHPIQLFVAFMLPTAQAAESFGVELIALAGRVGKQRYHK